MNVSLRGFFYLQNFSFCFIIFLFFLSGTEISEKMLNQKEVKQILQRERPWAARFLHGESMLHRKCEKSDEQVCGR